MKIGSILIEKALCRLHLQHNDNCHKNIETWKNRKLLAECTIIEHLYLP